MGSPSKRNQILKPGWISVWVFTNEPLQAPWPAEVVF